MRLSFLLLFPLILSACRNETSCEGNQPVAIFQPDIPRVLSHTFRLNEEGEALETLVLEDSFALELWQSNCHSTEQEFRFTIPAPAGASPTFPELVELTAAQFHRLSLLGPGYQPFSAWAQTISSHRQEFHRGRPLEVQQGISITIDAVPSEKELTLIARLETR